MQNKSLNSPGEFDYDYKNDILLFKVKEREYSHSIEMNRVIIDFDEERFIVAIQIIGASKVFNLSQNELRGIKHFQMRCKIEDNVIQIGLMFNMMVRNKPVKYNPIIFERVEGEIPNSEVLCQLA